MATTDHHHHHHHNKYTAATTTPPSPTPTVSSSIQALNTIIQLHFEKTLEKKRSVDLQKKQLFSLYHLFFITVAVIFASQSLSTRLQCRHCWAPIGLLTLAHLVCYVAVAQTLRCINGFKYQRRCHKLTLGVATERLRAVKMRMRDEDGVLGLGDEDFEVGYQEPDEGYFGKFKRNWAMHFGFLIFTYCFMVAFSVVLLCF
ncbi:hypothetical protein Scep_018751 [Stephania cephalantha]|uniref:Transmembrane protein n=1 Tax=Stephania cephalantha TaxID=152367 RepID=A0AAP0NKJ1_9MAGN